MMSTEEWSRVPARDAIRLLVRPFQQELFPRLEGELGPMGERYELFVAVLELVRVEALLPYFRGQVARPEEDRAALARAFIAKAVFDVPTTRALIERLEVDGRLWRLCGWSGGGRLPSEATIFKSLGLRASFGRELVNGNGIARAHAIAPAVSPVRSSAAVDNHRFAKAATRDRPSVNCLAARPVGTSLSCRVMPDFG